MNLDVKHWSKDEAFGYISFVASIGTIFDLMGKYLFTENTTSFSWKPTSGLELGIVVFLMTISMILLSKKEKNNKFLVVAGYLYAFMSFFIYVYTASQYIGGDKNIQNFSLEILIVFITSLIATIFIFKKLNDSKYFDNTSTIFLTGVFIVIGMFLFRVIGTNIELETMTLYQLLIYMVGGTMVYGLFYLLSIEEKPQIIVEKSNEKRKKSAMYDDTFEK